MQQHKSSMPTRLEPSRALITKYLIQVLLYSFIHYFNKKYINIRNHYEKLGKNWIELLIVFIILVEKSKSRSWADFCYYLWPVCIASEIQWISVYCGRDHRGQYWECSLVVADPEGQVTGRLCQRVRPLHIGRVTRALGAAAVMASTGCSRSALGLWDTCAKYRPAGRGI